MTPTTPTTDNIPISIGKVAEHFGVPVWQVRKMIKTGLVPEPPRIGPNRIFPPAWLPLIEAALIQSGYYQREGVVHAS